LRYDGEVLSTKKDGLTDFVVNRAKDPPLYNAFMHRAFSSTSLAFYVDVLPEVGKAE
jgi:hypothetical protein